ncbi:MAG: hypothetical protein JO299_21235 [Gammaproteobacteria bacterium]|nr:hypothetical protein [Gammaproteobacteria bacterium]
MHSDRLLEVAAEIGDQLCREAQPEGPGCGWYGLTPIAVTGGYSHKRGHLGADVYSGAAGNSLFLTQLYRLTQDERTRATAIAAARGALARAEEIEPPIRMSFYAGWMGIGFAAVVAGEVLDDRKLARDGRRLVQRAALLSANGRPTDQFLGCASAIAPLLALHRHSGADWPLVAASRIGDRLLASSVRRGNVRLWPPSGPMNELHRDALTGFAHGVSGIATALLELGVACDDPQLRDAAEEGFAYERRWYVPDQENWLDLRYMPGPDGDLNNGRTCQIQWCHGAAGIGLARLRAYVLLEADIYRSEAAAAVRTIKGDLKCWPNNWQPGFSLCHGVAGNSELLIEAGRVLHDEEAHGAARNAADLGIEHFAAAGAPWPGALGPQEIPSLLTGVAGTAWFLLRLSAPDLIPSLLLPSALELALSQPRFGRAERADRPLAPPPFTA